MSYFLKYSAEGKILMTGFVDDEHIPAGALVSDVKFDNITMLQKNHYVKDGQLVDRPTTPATLNKVTLAADGVDVVTMSDVPDGSFAATNIVTKEAVTGAISGIDTFSTTIPGTYEIKIESWPYLDFEATIEAI